jgi:group I intron endonuclease
MNKTNDREWCVYVHTNNINNKVYVGQTCLRPEKRWKKNGQGYLDLNDDGTYKQPAMARAILKYPNWDTDWTHEIVANHLTQDEANDLEIKLIDQYKSNCSKYQNPSFGYNMTDGGQGTNGIKLSDEAKQKISKSKINLSEETHKKMSESAKERCTEQWAIENSKIQSGSKRPQCSHSCDDLSKIKIKENNSKPVIQLTLDGIKIRKFSSQTEAEKITGVQQTAIWKCCNGEQESSGGYKWEYANKSKQNVSHNRGVEVVQLSMDEYYIKTWETASEAEKTLGISRCKVSTCCNGKRRSAGGFKWMWIFDWDKLQSTTQNELDEVG